MLLFCYIVAVLHCYINFAVVLVWGCIAMLFYCFACYVFVWSLFRSLACLLASLRFVYVLVCSLVGLFACFFAWLLFGRSLVRSLCLFACGLLVSMGMFARVLFDRLCICLFVCLSSCLFGCLCLRLFAFVRLFVCLFVRLFV